MDTPLVAYCAECSHSLGAPGRYSTAVGNAQQHARVTGHVVQVATSDMSECVETIYGEPGLPLWG